MRTFIASDDVAIAYYRWNQAGRGPTIVLHHGFASSAHGNWIATGWVDALVVAGHPVIAVDARGHGASAKPFDPEFYGERRMACDLMELFSELQLEQFDLVGYSMGAVTSLLVAEGDARVRRLVIGGVGEGVLECGGIDSRLADRKAIAGALLELETLRIANPMAAAFRAFVDFSGGDRPALAAQAMAMHQTPIELDRIQVPTLLFVGRDDPLARHPERLAGAINDCQLQLFAGDHLSVIRNPEAAIAVRGFLAG